MKSTPFLTALILCTAMTLMAQRRIQKGASPHGNLKIDCKVCHTTANWAVRTQSVLFKHDQTGFPLIGAHAVVACRDCHQDLHFANIGSSCIDCHTDIHRGQLGNQCLTCHNTRNWENRKKVFDQHARTRFPLLGVHAVTDCQACHNSDLRNEFVNAPLACQGCHFETYQETRDPDHPKAGFSTNCEQCHPVTASEWQAATYDHTQSFPLNGSHRALNCIDCHASQYSNLSKDCYACHEKDYQETTDPNHMEFGFLTDCILCHSDVKWAGSTFDHLAASGFELVQTHNTLKCT